MSVLTVYGALYDLDSALLRRTIETEHSNIAAHDLWCLAAQHLEALREVVKRAEEVEAGRRDPIRPVEEVTRTGLLGDTTIVRNRAPTTPAPAASHWDCGRGDGSCSRGGDGPTCDGCRAAYDAKQSKSDGWPRY